MHNPAPVLENATHKLLWDFNIQTDHQIPGRRPDLMISDKMPPPPEHEQKSKIQQETQIRNLW